MVGSEEEVSDEVHGYSSKVLREDDEYLVVRESFPLPVRWGGKFSNVTTAITETNTLIWRLITILSGDFSIHSLRNLKLYLSSIYPTKNYPRKILKILALIARSGKYNPVVPIHFYIIAAKFILLRKQKDSEGLGKKLKLNTKVVCRLAEYLYTSVHNIDSVGGLEEKE